MHIPLLLAALAAAWVFQNKWLLETTRNSWFALGVLGALQLPIPAELPHLAVAATLQIIAPGPFQWTEGPVRFSHHPFLHPFMFLCIFGAINARTPPDACDVREGKCVVFFLFLFSPCVPLG